MEMYDEVVVNDDVIVGVRYNHIEGERCINYYEDGSGYPGSPSTIEISEISLVKGTIFDLVLAIEYEKGWLDWLEGKLFELND